MSQCPQCGAQTTVDQPFCGSCGASLAPAAEAPAPPGEAPTQIRGAQPRPDQASSADQPSGEQPAYGAPQSGQQGYGAPQQGGYGQPQGQYQSGPQGQPAYGAPQQGGYGQPQGQYQGQPAYGPPQQGGQHGGSSVNVDFSKVLAGNWAGMAMVAGAAFGVALLLGALFAFTAAQDLDFASAIATTLLIAGSTFGANVILKEEPADSVEVVSSFGHFPLLITVAALAVAIYLFRSQTRRHADVKLALFDAGRAALVLMAIHTVLAIVMRIWSPEVKGYEGGASGESMFPPIGPLGLGIGSGEALWLSIAGSIFLTFILFFVVLSLSCFVRADWLRGKWSLVHAWASGPLHGIAALVVLSLAGGLIYLIAIIIGNDDAREFDKIMRLVAVLPALGVRLLGLGVFANVGGKAKADGDSDDSFDRLPDFADDNGALFWIAPVIALATMAGAIYAVIMKSFDRSKVMRNVLVFLGLLLVVVPFMVRFANVHFTYKVDNDGDSEKTTMWLGVDGFQTTFFFFLFAVVVALVLLLITNNLDINSLVGKAQGMAAQARQQGQYGQPGAYGPQGQPGQQQWGQQPPQQGGQQGWGQPQPPQGQPPQQGQPGQWGQPQQPPQPGQQGWGQPQPPQGQPPQGQPPQQGQPGQWGPPPQQGGQQGWGQPPQQ